MRITGKRIRALRRHLRGIQDGTTVVVGVLDAEAHKEQLVKAGFSGDLTDGETLLPKPVGPVSKYNAEGRYIIHKDRPKEKAYREFEWTWSEWRGPYRETRSRTVYQEYWRYPRTFVEPPSVELTIVHTGAGKTIVTAPVTLDPAHEQDLLHRINLILELFGECDVLTENLEPFLEPNVRRLNWTVLPPGEMPWEQLSERLEPILSEMGERKRPVAEYRLRVLTRDHQPDFTAVGEAGFRGYIVFGFQSKNLYVVESLQYGNATYVFRDDWERLSRMTKKEILDGNLQHARIIHREDWRGRIGDLLE